MKKVLFATTALVMTAGVASAEIALSGSANVGMKYAESTTAQELTLHHEIDVDVKASVETDAGLTFGMSFDLDPNPAQVNDSEVSVSGAFGTVTIGNTDSAADQYFGNVEVGFDGIGLDDAAEGAYVVGSADVLYTYSVGALSVAASINSSETDDSIGFGVQYAGPVTIALGYSDNGTVDATNVGVYGSAGAVAYKVTYSDNSASGAAYGIGGTYKVNDALSIQAAYGDSDAATDASVGAGFTYDLGGASLAGGVGSINGQNKADLGVNFKF